MSPSAQWHYQGLCMNHQGTGLFLGWSGSFIVCVTVPWEVQGSVGSWLCLGVS